MFLKCLIILDVCSLVGAGKLFFKFRFCQSRIFGCIQPLSIDEIF